MVEHERTQVPYVRQTANLFIYESSHRKAVEAVCECLPEPDIVSPFALIIESINPIDGCALMVASEQEEVFWVFNLHRTKRPFREVANILKVRA